MSRLFREAKSIFFNIKFLGFCLVGIINTFNTAFFSWVGHFFLQENIAAIFGYFVSLMIAFIMNSIFLFKHRPSAALLGRFLISYIPSFIIYFLFTFVTINTLDIPQFWATVIAVVLGGPVTFIIVRLYAFGLNEKESRNI